MEIDDETIDIILSNADCIANEKINDIQNKIKKQYGELPNDILDTLNAVYYIAIETYKKAITDQFNLMELALIPESDIKM